MVRRLIFIFGLMGVHAGFAQGPVSNVDRDIVFKSVNVIPMDRETVLKDQTVVVRNGKILSIGSNAKAAGNALVVDPKGTYLVPGTVAYRQRGYDPAATPAALDAAERGIALPLYESLTHDEHDRVVTAVTDVLAARTIRA